MVAVVAVDAQLTDDLKRVLAPVIDVDQRVIERRAVISREAVALAKCAGSGEDIGRSDLFQKPLGIPLASVGRDSMPQTFRENSSPGWR